MHTDELCLTSLLLLLQASREERSSSCPVPAPAAAPAVVSASQRLMEETLARPAPYPMILLPPEGAQGTAGPGRGYWLDGADSDASAGHPASLPSASPLQDWRAHKFETDETARCYRRFFVGRVSIVSKFVNSWVGGGWKFYSEGCRKVWHILGFCFNLYFLKLFSKKRKL